MVTLLVLDIFTTVLLFLYVLARLSLIVQAVALLRHQPARGVCCCRLDTSVQLALVV